MQILVSERELALQLLRALTDERGWRCPVCDHTRFTQPSTRPRSIRCTRCRHERSVTSGTALQASKLTLWQWMRVRHTWQLHGLPTCTVLARAVGIARSTAWHVNQRALRAFFRAFDLTGLGRCLLTFSCRPPKGAARHDIAPRHRPFLNDFRRSPDRRVRYTFRYGPPSRLVDGPLPLGAPEPDDPLDPAASACRDDLERVLREIHQSPCLRWIERYADWYLRTSPDRRDPLPFLLSAPARSLDQLRR